MQQENSLLYNNNIAKLNYFQQIILESIKIKPFFLDYSIQKPVPVTMRFRILLPLLNAIDMCHRYVVTKQINTNTIRLRANLENLSETFRLVDNFRKSRPPHKPAKQKRTTLPKNDIRSTMDQQLTTRHKNLFQSQTRVCSRTATYGVLYTANRDHGTLYWNAVVIITHPSFHRNEACCSASVRARASI